RKPPKFHAGVRLCSRIQIVGADGFTARDREIDSSIHCVGNLLRRQLELGHQFFHRVSFDTDRPRIEHRFPCPPPFFVTRNREGHAQQAACPVGVDRLPCVVSADGHRTLEGFNRRPQIGGWHGGFFVQTAFPRVQQQRCVCQPRLADCQFPCKRE